MSINTTKIKEAAKAASDLRLAKAHAALDRIEAQLDEARLLAALTATQPDFVYISATDAQSILLNYSPNPNPYSFGYAFEHAKDGHSLGDTMTELYCIKFNVHYLEKTGGATLSFIRR